MKKLIKYFFYVNIEILLDIKHILTDKPAAVTCGCT